MIEIDGTNTGEDTEDAILHFMPTADGSTVRGLVLNRAASSGILVEGTDGLVIEGNFIGTNPAGTAGLGNAFVGILLNTGPANVTIGGTTPAARNLISGNTFNGIVFGQAGGAGGGGTNHLVQGNLIGTDASGGNAIPGQEKGIETLGVTSNILIGGTTAASRNVVSGNAIYGIRFRGTGAGKVASGNYCGNQPGRRRARPQRELRNRGGGDGRPRRRHGGGRGQPRFRQRAEWHQHLPGRRRGRATGTSSVRTRPELSQLATESKASSSAPTARSSAESTRARPTPSRTTSARESRSRA